MPTFAQKQNRPQQKTSATLTRSNGLAPAASQEVHRLLHLQRTIGNQAALRLLRGRADRVEAAFDTEVAPATQLRSEAPSTSRMAHGFSRIPVHAPAAITIQTKLGADTPGDIYEQEADQVAERVMRMPERKLGTACSCGGGCSKCQTDQPSQEPQRLQTKHVGSSDSGQVAAPPLVHEVLASPGQPLDAATRAFFEPRFAHDFSNVRVHTGERARASGRAINADAYTLGEDIVLNGFSPHSSDGDKLLAHELTHVVQQAGGPSVVQRKPKSAPLTVMNTEGGIEGVIANTWSAALRKEPSRDSRVLADLPRGQRVLVKGGRGWLKVQTLVNDNLLVGYVSYELIKFAEKKASELVERPPCIHNYRVELKAWIPFDWVVDPESFGIGTHQHSEYKGDSHIGYEGSYRAFVWVEFQWDGRQITNFRHGGDFGESERDAIIASRKGTATCCTSAKLVDDNSFLMDIETKNPLTLMQSLTPTIDTNLGFKFLAYDVIGIKSAFDYFPSQGFKVSREGKPIETRIINDASGVDPNSRMELGLGLVRRGIDTDVIEDRINICPEGVTKQPPVEMYPDTMPP